MRRRTRRERAKARDRATRWFATAAAVASVAGASEAVTYTETDIAPDFSGTFEDRTVLPLDADAVVGVSSGVCPAPFFCVSDYDHFAFGGLAPGTSFSIALEMLSDGYPPPPFVFIADHTFFQVYDHAQNPLFGGTNSRPEDPLWFDGVVPVSGEIVVLAFGPAAIDDLLPLTARYRVALDAQVIPEPATALLVGGGLAALGAGRLRARRKGSLPPERRARDYASPSSRSCASGS